MALEKKLTRFLVKLPSESLKQLARTEDQIDHWRFCQGSNRMVADCWLARITFSNDPLANLLEIGQINESVYETVHATARFFHSLWGVIYVGEKYIKKELGATYPFKSAFELFKEVLQVWHDNKFKICLEPYWGLTVADLGKSAGVIQGCIEGSLEPSEVKGKPHSINALRSLTAGLTQFNNHWFVLSLGVCEAYSAKDPSLRAELKTLHSQLLNVSDLVKTAVARKRASKKYSKLTTTYWRNGNKVIVKRT